MNIYLEYSINYAYLYLAFSFIWLNLSLILDDKYKLVEKLIKNKYLSFGFRVFFVFIIGMYIDESTAIETLNLYTNWQTYAIFLTMVFLICMPGFLYLIIKKYL
jgi:hypothetical protein